MWGRSWKPLVIVLPWAAIVLVVLYIIYRLVDPLPPRHFAIAAGIPGTGYDVLARQYALKDGQHDRCQRERPKNYLLSQEGQSVERKIK